MTRAYSKSVYKIFLITMLVAICIKALVVIYYVDLQKDDAQIINQSGRQRMISQDISKILLLVNSDLTYSQDDNYKLLLELSNTFKSSHIELTAESEQLENEEITTLLDKNKDFVFKTNELIVNLNRSKNSSAVRDYVLSLEGQFLKDMDEITRLFQSQAEDKITNSKTATYILALVTMIIIVLEFFYFVRPATNQIHDQNVRLNLANRQLSDFAQITAHNLRAPIGNLGFLADFYDDAVDEAEKDELFSNVKIVIGHLDETVRILVESISVQNNENVSMEKLDLNTVFNHTKEMLVGEIKATDATITSNFNAVSSINYSKVYLDSIFLNLIGNALKYAAPDRKPQIHVTSSIQSGSVVLRFKDNGLGINLERQGDKIFKLHKTFHRHKDARGIGLFMTRNQVQAMGGDISVTSEVDKGSQFKVTFKI